MSVTKKNGEKLRQELDDILTQQVTARDENTFPTINGIIAGVTNDKENIYLNAKGVKNIETGESISINDIVSYYSCTKSITAMGLLTLYERGEVDIEVPVKTYLPEIELIGLIDPGQVNEKDGTFKEPPRKPQNQITLRHLLCHTAGFSYPFINEDYSLLALRGKSRINGSFPTKEFFTTEKLPLVHEPGTEWGYGHNIDWVGLVIEKVSGKKLGEYLKENVFDPIGMKSCTFRVKDPRKLVRLHKRHGDGKISLIKKKVFDLDPEVDMGGHGCFGSIGDYLRFIRVWLNFGISPDTGKRILKTETVEYARMNHLSPGLHVNFDTAVSYFSSSNLEPDGFTLTGNAYCMNNLPTGRPKGSIYWSGLANLYFWIDFENKIGGFWGSQLLPYMDNHSLMSYTKFEYKVYEALKASKKELEGRNASNL